MSRMFRWERWPTLLIGYTCLLLRHLTMASIQTVPSTCGYEFFLPPIQRSNSSCVVSWLEVVACRDFSSPAVSVKVTIYTAANDVVHTLSLSSNETARLELADMLRKDESIGKHGLRLSVSLKTSVYAHLSGGNDVMNIIPLDAITTSYLIPDLRTSEFEEQRVFFYNIYSQTNVTVTTHSYSNHNSLRQASEIEAPNSSNTSSNISHTGSADKNDFKSEADTHSDSTANWTSKPAGDYRDLASVSLPSTTTIKATPTIVSGKNSSRRISRQGIDSSSSSSSSSSNNNNNNNVTTSIFYFSAAMQTRSFLVESDSTVFLRSSQPLGVVVLISQASSYSSSPSSPDTSSASWLEDDVARTDCSSCEGGDGERVVVGEEESITMEMMMPLASLGRHFYLPLVKSFGYVRLVVAGQENATVEIHWDNSSDGSVHRLIALHSLVLEQPIRNLPADGHIWIVASSPILVYVFVDHCAGADQDISAGGSDPQCYVNAFFLPAVEQYFWCAVDMHLNSCETTCPSFWRSDACGLQGESGGILSLNISGREMAGSSISNSRKWRVRQSVRQTTANTTDACVIANGSYVLFRLDLGTGSFLPAGTRLAKLYSSCVPNISAQGGQGDGVDNDCDGLVDEESENMKDDDGDERIDEDTAGDCDHDDASSRTARSGDLRKSVNSPETNPIPPWVIDYDEEDSEMPLLAVIISLSVAIFAVIAVISIFLLMELMSRRRQIRNTKIRPFVS